MSYIPPLVPEHAPSLVKVALLPLTIPIAIALILVESVLAIADVVWKVLHDD